MIGIVRSECIHDPDAATAKQYYRMGQLLYECTLFSYQSFLCLSQKIQHQIISLNC